MFNVAPHAHDFLSDCASSVTRGQMGMADFCSAVRRNLGGPVLLHAMLAISGDPPRSSRGLLSARALNALIDHSRRCECSNCAVNGCRGMRLMQSAIQSHAVACRWGPENCGTCRRWRRLAHRTQGASACAPALQRTPVASSVATRKRDGANQQDKLMVLAQLALGEVSTLTHPNALPEASACSSPNTSPSASFRKKPKRGTPSTCRPWGCDTACGCGDTPCRDSLS